MWLFQEAAASLALSTGLIVVGIALALWLHYERSHRERDLSRDDAVHYSRQDIRRASVALILGFLAIGIFVGSRTSPVAAGRVNAHFLQIWLSVSGLVVVLIVLAMVDWLATRAYARRHFRELTREKLEFLSAELRRQAQRERNGNGSAGNLGDSSSS